jgi:poly-gamma-glutamate synthesis protein (capsule biosynthesis protein)
MENKFSPSIKFVGDIVIKDQISHKLDDVIIEKLKSVFTLGNLEVPFTTSKINADKWAALKQSPSLVTELLKININGVSLATNHMLDFGFEGLDETLKNLKKNGIKYTGAGNNLEEALSPIEFNVNNAKIRIYSLATTLPPSYAANRMRPGIAPIRVRCSYYFDGVFIEEQPGTYPMVFCQPDEIDMKRIKKLVEKSKREGFLIVVTLHWGMPYQYNLMDYQRYIAHELINYGADLIIGHHPHVLQQIEKYKGKFIFYSLGNFIWQPQRKWRSKETKYNFWPPQYGKWAMSDDSAIVEVEVNSEKIVKAKIIPVTLKDGIPALLKNETNFSHVLFKEKKSFFGKLEVIFEKGENFYNIII